MASTDGLTITFEQVSNTASDISSINTQLDGKLHDIKREMDNLAQTWQSDASNSIRANFDNLESKFQDFKELIDSYGRFLNQTVSTYTEMESKLNSNANAFR